MAVTLLSHMKEAKGANPSSHLKNAINYILNPKKTENGLWTGSNCGTNVEEIYNTMIDTKEAFSKRWGRQGYHFVISFPPDVDIDEKKTYEFAKRFCEAYLGQNYEYCFAVHNDQDHMHCHIVFNSVDRIAGNKYRYVDGDWEKKIQPVTDALCREFGLPELEYDKSKRVGKSYVEHMANKDGKIVWADIIRADIDAAASRSYSRDEFFKEMKNMGYRFHIGNSKGYGEYVTYYPPGAAKGRRDYRLGAGYSIREIDEKISSPTFVPNNLYDSKFSKIKTDNSYQRYIVLRIKQATAYHIFRCEELDQARVRRDLLHINQLEEECDYLIRRPISSASELEDRLQLIEQRISAEKRSLESNNAILEQFMPEEKEIIAEYQYLKCEMSNPDITDETFESFMDRLEQLEKDYADILAYANIRLDVATSDKLEELKYEKRILRRIQKDVVNIQKIKEATLRQDVKQEELSIR